MQTQNQKLPAAFLFWCAMVFFIAVAATIHFCRSMSGCMDMPGGWTMSMMWMPMPGYTWTGSAALFLFAWLMMMVAMMLPSAWPMFLNVRRSSPGNFETLAIFAASGYFFVWTIIGAIVYALGVAFALATMHLDWLSRLAPALSGMTLIVAGIIQFTPWKIAALRRCRAPDCGILLNGSTSRRGWRYGFRQGMSCGICCTPPMLALLVLGAMNLAAMTLIAAIIATEKLLPRPEVIARVFGAIALAMGTAFLIRAL